MTHTLNLSKKLIAVSLCLALITSCSNNSNLREPPEQGATRASKDVSWANHDSLVEPIKEALARSCPFFIAEGTGLKFLADFKEFSLRTVEVGGANLLVYLDGAIEPEIDDEVSTALFYEEWGCSSDTLFIEEIRFSSTDFNGKENPISIFSCVDEYVIEPVRVVITCADANMGVEDIVWSSWNNMEASGIGIFYENNCSPDCASGRFIRQNAMIQLTGMQKDKFGKSVFTELIVQTVRKQQSGGYMETYSLYFEE